MFVPTNVIGNVNRIPPEIVDSPEMTWLVLSVGGVAPIAAADQKFQNVIGKWRWVDDHYYPVAKQGRAVFLGVRLAKRGRARMLEKLCDAFDAAPVIPVSGEPMHEVLCPDDDPEAEPLRLDGLVPLTLRDFGMKSPATVGR